jgi:hypothetical protein
MRHVRVPWQSVIVPARLSMLESVRLCMGTERERGSLRERERESAHAREKESERRRGSAREIATRARERVRAVESAHAREKESARGRARERNSDLKNVL